MGQRFEPSGENFEFVQGRSSLPRNPGVFTTPPLDPVAGDILVDQNGEQTTLYVSVNQTSLPYARTGEFRPQTWAPIQTSVGSAPVASYGVRLWEEDVTYKYSDVVLVDDGNGGFLMWLALDEHADTEPAPTLASHDGWAPIGSASVGGTSSVEYLWGGDVTGVDPGAGNIRISGTGNQPRVIAISETDADGLRRNYGVLKAGDTLVVTDDPDAPPITGFARFLLIADPVDEGAWWSAQALRTDTAGVATPPAVGTRLRVNAHLTDGGGGTSEPVDAAVAQSWRDSNDWPVPAVATTIPFEQVLNTDATVVEAAATGLFTIRQAGTYLVNVDLNIASTPMPVTAFAILTGFVDPANGAEFVAAQQIDSSQAERSQMTLTFPIVLSAAQVPATVRIAADSNGTGVVVRGSAANRRSQASIIRLSGLRGEPGSGGSGDFVLRSGDTMTGPLVVPSLRTDSAGIVVPSQQGIGIADATSWVRFRSGAGIGIWLRDPAGSIFHTAPGHIWQEQGGVQLMSLVWDRLTLQSNTIDVPYGFRIAALSQARADILRNSWELLPGLGDTAALSAAGGAGSSVILAPAGVTAAQRVLISSNGRMETQGMQLRVTHNTPQFLTWDNAMILSNGQGLGNSIAMYVPGLAPQIRVSQSRGEIIDFVNSASNAFITIGASVFQVGSARRTKRDITAIPASRLLDVAKRVNPVSYLPVVRPQTLRVDPEKVAKLRAEFTAAQIEHYASLVDADGNPAPMPKDVAEPDFAADPKAFTNYDHDCGIDGCDGECVITRNDHARVGFIAEELADVLPEAIVYDADGVSGFDVAQVAVTALAAVGELTRMVEALTTRVAELEAR